MRTIAKAITDAKQNQMLTVLHMFDLQLIFKTDSDDVFSYLMNSYSSSSYTCKADVSIYVVISTSDFDEEMSIDTITVDGPHLSLHGGGVRGGADAISKRAWCEGAAALRFRAADAGIARHPHSVSRHPQRPACAARLGNRVGRHGDRSGGTQRRRKKHAGIGGGAGGACPADDDTVYIQTNPRLTLWGLKRPLHVFAFDAPFAEGPLRLRAGRWKKAVRGAAPCRQGATRDPVRAGSRRRRGAFAHGCGRCRCQPDGGAGAGASIISAPSCRRRWARWPRMAPGG